LLPILKKDIENIEDIEYRMQHCAAGGQGVLRKHIVISVSMENLCKYGDTSGMRSSNVGIHGNTVGNACHPC
jgi:hypothetical protein